MTTITDFDSFSILDGKSMQARIEVGESSVTLPAEVCAFAGGVFSMGILRVCEKDLESCEIDFKLAEKGTALFDALVGVSTATMHLLNGITISLSHAI